MPTGAITGHIDVAQVVLYAFWIFFAGLILYLRREDKREGYPMETDRPRGRPSTTGFVGFPTMPAPKRFTLAHGDPVMAPSGKVDTRTLNAVPAGRYPGAPLMPEGDPMRAEIGPGAYAMRADVPDMTLEGEPKIVPLREATDFYLEPRDPDPRGMAVVGADGKVAGTVTDAWVDKSEYILRYLEVELPGGETPRHVLLPVNFTTTSRSRRQVRVNAILASQFADVPALANPTQVTFLEEERICAYYGAGTLYATRARQEPLL
ncbi:photosynthetic reaction center subunit H [Amorphus orientalis]|uniref:Photosynthetic reaction center H subunit n=1 Tax=Amorphus orientalis TaxID=649198 RepID=A0AAE3VNS2_9HYPH|nr:photosynthetic reaction center subunit H [Amorphus orientalis]MDQ0315458.1 photosynthetic reaction center H subunit [Amorphus orientalis]